MITCLYVLLLENISSIFLNMTRGKLIRSDAREIIFNVFCFMKQEATQGVLIPITNFKERLLAATKVSEKIYRQVVKEGKESLKGGRLSFTSPSSKRNRKKKSDLIEEQSEITLHDFPLMEERQPTLKGVEHAEIGDKEFPVETVMIEESLVETVMIEESQLQNSRNGDSLNDIKFQEISNMSIDNEMGNYKSSNLGAEMPESCVKSVADGIKLKQVKLVIKEEEPVQGESDSNIANIKNEKPDIVSYEAPKDETPGILADCQSNCYTPQNHSTVLRDQTHARILECCESASECKHAGSLTEHSRPHEVPSQVQMFKCDNCEYQSKQKDDLESHDCT